MKKYNPGVLFGEELEALYKDAKENQFALPAVNTIGTDSINATLETAAKVNSPVIIQFSNGGAQFIAGKGMPNDKLQGNISGAISGALHIHNVAKYYGVPVVLHTDHAAKKWLPWISGLIDAGEQFFKEKKQPLFSSHMLDLSEEPIEENIHTSVDFYKRMAPLGMGIEIELGVTGGEEDGVDNSGIENDKLYTQPAHVEYAGSRNPADVFPLFPASDHHSYPAVAGGPWIRSEPDCAGIVLDRSAATSCRLHCRALASSRP